MSPEIGVHCDVEEPGSDQFINIQVMGIQDWDSKVQYVGCCVRILDMHSYSLSLYNNSL